MIVKPAPNYPSFHELRRLVRQMKNTGDGLLAEFLSVVDAVRCAVEVQRGMMDREPDVPEEALSAFAPFPRVIDEHRSSSSPVAPRLRRS
jgi:hypothetical protein